MSCHGVKHSIVLMRNAGGSGPQRSIIAPARLKHYHYVVSGSIYLFGQEIYLAMHGVFIPRKIAPNQSILCSTHCPEVEDPGSYFSPVSTSCAVITGYEKYLHFLAAGAISPSAGTVPAISKSQQEDKGYRLPPEEL